MPQNELLVDVLRRNLGMLKMTVGDMTDADLIQRPVPNANNALWQMGHLITAEAGMVNAAAGKTVAELPAGFAEKFKKETAGLNDASKLGTKAELLALQERVRESVCKWVATLSADDLAKQTPERMQSFCPTIGHLIHLIPDHLAMHVGQLQVLRRKLGKPILF